MSTLQGDELRQAAGQARAVNEQLAGGATVVITTTTIIIILLIVILIVALAVIAVPARPRRWLASRPPCLCGDGHVPTPAAAAAAAGSVPSADRSSLRRRRGRDGDALLGRAGCLSRRLRAARRSLGGRHPRRPRSSRDLRAARLDRRRRAAAIAPSSTQGARPRPSGDRIDRRSARAAFTTLSSSSAPGDGRPARSRARAVARCSTRHGSTRRGRNPIAGC